MDDPILLFGLVDVRINHSCHRLHGDCTIERLGNNT